MLVSELIEILKDQPQDAEVELSVVAPVSDEDDDITVDRYSIEGVLPWDDAEGAPADDGGDDGEVVIWLIGGEEKDVESFLDAIDPEGDEG
jgi:hypothetical protein